jgi:hypothetical protein
LNRLLGFTPPQIAATIGTSTSHLPCGDGENSDMHWIHDFPSWAAAPLCILAFVLPTAAGLWLVYRNVHQRLRFRETLVDNGVIGWFFSGIFTLYGITLGLIAVTTWENFMHVSGIVSQEAASIAALYRDASGYPSPLRDDLHSKLREYTQFVIEQAWPAQRRGEILTDSNRILDEFESILLANEPKTEGQRILQSEVLKAFNQLIEFRRQRIEAVHESVPGVIGAVVLVGGVLTILASFCFQLQEFRLHLLLSTGLAVMIALLVFLIGALDRPYRGAVSIEPTAYQIVLDGLMTNSEK